MFCVLITQSSAEIVGKTGGPLALGRIDYHLPELKTQIKQSRRRANCVSGCLRQFPALARESFRTQDSMSVVSAAQPFMSIDCLPLDAGMVSITGVRIMQLRSTSLAARPIWLQIPLPIQLQHYDDNTIDVMVVSATSDALYNVQDACGSRVSNFHRSFHL